MKNVLHHQCACTSELGLCSIGWVAVSKNSNRAALLHSMFWGGYMFGTTWAASTDCTLAKWRNKVAIHTIYTSRHWGMWVIVCMEDHLWCLAYCAAGTCCATHCRRWLCVVVPSPWTSNWCPIIHWYEPLSPTNQVGPKAISIHVLMAFIIIYPGASPALHFSAFLCLRKYVGDMARLVPWLIQVYVRW